MCGAGDIKIPKQLLADGELTCNKSAKAATAVEEAVRNLQDLHLDNKDIQNESINQVHSPQ